MCLAAVGGVSRPPPAIIFIFRAPKPASQADSGTIGKTGRESILSVHSSQYETLIKLIRGMAEYDTVAVRGQSCPCRYLSRPENPNGEENVQAKRTGCPRKAVAQQKEQWQSGRSCRKQPTQRKVVPQANISTDILRDLIDKSQQVPGKRMSGAFFSPQSPEKACQSPAEARPGLDYMAFIRTPDGISIELLQGENRKKQLTLGIN